MSWHVQPELLEHYASGDIDQLQAYSIEAHLPSCEDCRNQIAILADDARLARVWDDIEARIDAPAAARSRRSSSASACASTSRVCSARHRRCGCPG